MMRIAINRLISIQPGLNPLLSDIFPRPHGFVRRYFAFLTVVGNWDNENPELSDGSVWRIDFGLSIEPVNELKDWNSKHPGARNDVVATNICF